MTANWQKILIGFLLAMVFTAGLSAAVDHHGHDAGTQHQSQDDAGHDHADEHSGDGCEHCGHLGGHLLGLLAGLTDEHQDSAATAGIRIEQRLSGRSFPPRLRPPKR